MFFKSFVAFRMIQLKFLHSSSALNYVPQWFLRYSRLFFFGAQRTQSYAISALDLRPKLPKGL